MYSLKEAWMIMHGSVPFEGWDGLIYCNLTDYPISLRANKTQGYFTAFTYTLILEGWIKVIYSGKELTLNVNDLLIYSPGMGITVLDASDNYRGVCLMADEHFSLSLPAVHDMLRIAYLPIVRLQEPRVTLQEHSSKRLENRMMEITEYLHSDLGRKSEIVQHLYAVFLLDLQSEIEVSSHQKNVPKRVEEIFMGFISLLPDNFILNRNIAFYSNALNITTTYLSRVVRLVTGRTVLDYIHSYLIMEATFLLNTSRLSVSQIADRLHFPDQTSFSRFFTRATGLSPRQYRQR